MKNFLLTLLGILSGVTLIFSCDSSEPDTVTAPQIEIANSGDFQISYTGGLQTLEYTVTNSIEGAVISADAGGVEWIDGINTSVEGKITFNVEENEQHENRTTVMTVRYTYEDSEVETSINLVQDAAGYTYELSLENAYGTYFGALNRTSGMRYVLYLTENPMQNNIFGTGLNYCFDIYAEAPVDQTSIRLPEGTYVLSRTYEAGCLNSDGTFIYNSDIGRHTFFIRCSLNIAYEGDNIVIEALIFDQNGDSHKITHTGPVVFDDQSYYSSFDDDYEADFSGCAGTAEYLGDYYGNGCSTFAVEIVPISGNGQYLMLELLAPESANIGTGIPTGTYTINWSEKEFTALPGTLTDGYMTNSWLSDCENNSVKMPWTPLAGGSVEISSDGGVYTIELKDMDDDPTNPHSITGTWSGEIEIK